MAKFLKACMCTLIMGMFFFFTAEIVQAQELNSSNVIDRIDLEKSSFTSGELTSIHVSFSEKQQQQLKAGDTITLNLPKELEGLTEKGGLPRSIDLNGLGEVLIYKNVAVCTFNDKVNNLDNIKGEFKIAVRIATIGENETKIVKTNFGVNVANKTIEINGPSGNYDTGKLPFFYKTGDMLGDSGNVRWFLNANLNKEDLAGDIFLHDKIGVGQIVNKDSFSFQIDNYLGKSSLNLTQFVEQGYGSVEFISDNEFRIVIKRQKARLASFSILYTTKVTENGINQEFFENNCQIDYRILYKNPLVETGEHKVKNIFTSGTADGDALNRGKEEVQVDESEVTEDIPSFIPETIEGKEVADEKETATIEEKPHVIVNEGEEIVTDESEIIEELLPLVPEVIGGKEVADEKETATIEEKPQIRINEVKEEVTDESETIEELPSITPETIESKEVPEEKAIVGIEEKPQVEVSMEQKVIEEPKETKELTQVKADKTLEKEVAIQKTLPKTGSKNEAIGYLYGSGFFLIALSLTVFKRKNMRHHSK